MRTVLRDALRVKGHRRDVRIIETGPPAARGRAMASSNMIEGIQRNPYILQANLTHRKPTSVRPRGIVAGRPGIRHGAGSGTLFTDSGDHFLRAVDGLCSRSHSQPRRMQTTGIVKPLGPHSRAVRRDDPVPIKKSARPRQPRARFCFDRCLRVGGTLAATPSGEDLAVSTVGSYPFRRCKPVAVAGPMTGGQKWRATASGNRAPSSLGWVSPARSSPRSGAIRSRRDGVYRRKVPGRGQPRVPVTLTPGTLTRAHRASATPCGLAPSPPRRSDNPPPSPSEPAQQRGRSAMGGVFLT